MATDVNVVSDSSGILQELLSIKEIAERDSGTLSSVNQSLNDFLAHATRLQTESTSIGGLDLSPVVDELQRIANILQTGSGLGSTVSAQTTAAASTPAAINASVMGIGERFSAPSMIDSQKINQENIENVTTRQSQFRPEQLEGQKPPEEKGAVEPISAPVVPSSVRIATTPITSIAENPLIPTPINPQRIIQETLDQKYTPEYRSIRPIEEQRAPSTPVAPPIVAPPTPPPVAPPTPTVAPPTPPVVPPTPPFVAPSMLPLTSQAISEAPALRAERYDQAAAAQGIVRYTPEYHAEKLAEAKTTLAEKNISPPALLPMAGAMVSLQQQQEQALYTQRAAAALNPPTKPTNISEAYQQGGMSGAASAFMENAGRVTNAIGRTAALPVGMALGAAAAAPRIANNMMAAGNSMQQLRAMAYKTGQTGGGMLPFGAAMYQNLTQQPIEQALGISSLANSLVGLFPGLGSALGVSGGANGSAMAGALGISQDYADVIKTAYGSGGQISQAVGVASIQEAIKRGYSGKVFDEFWKAGTAIYAQTKGAIDPTMSFPLLDLMYRKFDQPVSTTAKTLEGFNTAAMAAKKGLAEYTSEITSAVTALQQGGLSAPSQAVSALDAARVAASVPGISATGVMSIANKFAPYTAQLLPGKFNQLDYIAMMTGNITSTVHGSPSEQYLYTAEAANKMVNQLMKGIAGTPFEKKQTALMLAANITQTQPGDLSNLIDDLPKLKKEVALSALEDKLRGGTTGKLKGSAGATQLKSWTAEFNSLYGITDAASRKTETRELSILQSGKETLAQAIQNIQKNVNVAGTTSQQPPVIGTIEVTATPGTTAKVRPGSTTGSGSKPRAATGSTQSISVSQELLHPVTLSGG